MNHNINNKTNIVTLIIMWQFIRPIWRYSSTYHKVVWLHLVTLICIFYCHFFIQLICTCSRLSLLLLKTTWLDLITSLSQFS